MTRKYIGVGGLVGMGVGLTLAGVAACGGGFSASDCMADRTCAEPGGQGSAEGGSGVGGEAAPSGVGGELAAGGVGAASDTGGAGDTGGGEQGTSLSVASVSPEDGATEVERDDVVEVTFSEPVNPASVTSDSFSVEGPEGKIAGKLSVAGAVVTFTPDAAFDLLGSYTIALSTDILGKQSGALEATQQFAFQARDGKFRAPERISTSDAVNLTLTGNRAGHVAAYWFTNEAKSNAEAAVFDPIKAAWGEAALLENDDSLSYDPSCVALNENGQAFATLRSVTAGGTTTGGGWNRRLGADWGIARLSVVKESRGCALADDGTAMTTWMAVAGNGADVFAASLSANDQWSSSQTLQVNGKINDFRSTARFGTGFIVLYSRDSDRALLSNVWEPKSGWLAPKLISADTTLGQLATAGAQAMALWLDKNDRLQASLLDGADWAPAKELGAAGEATGSLGSNGNLAVWSSQGVWASLYDSTNGWTDALKLAENPDGFPPTGVIDDRGNALVAWMVGRNIRWRRWLASAKAWGEAVDFKDQDVTSYGAFSSVDAAGNIMLVWQNQLGVWASRFE